MSSSINSDRVRIVYMGTTVLIFRLVEFRLYCNFRCENSLLDRMDADWDTGEYIVGEYIHM